MLDGPCQQPCILRDINSLIALIILPSGDGPIRSVDDGGPLLAVAGLEREVDKVVDFEFHW